MLLVLFLDLNWNEPFFCYQLFFVKCQENRPWKMINLFVCTEQCVSTSLHVQ